LPWRDLFKPAIDLCTNGFPISKPLFQAINRSFKEGSLKDPALLKIFIDPSTGQIYKINQTVKMIELGRTLKLISESNNDEVFYKSPLTGLMVSEINENGW
jgi:gamma-glutamyltranspeptidase